MRKHNRISRIAVLTMVVLLGLLSGCAQRATVSYPAFGTQIDETEQENGPVVENSRFRLEWDNKNKQITLVDIVRNVRWSPTPTGSSEQLLDEFGLPVKNHPMVESAILVDYIEADTQNLVTSNSYNGAVRNGRVSCSPLSDGLKVTYFFDQEEFAVPVEYRLRESGMEITIDPTEIQEGRNKVFKVAVAPFFCAVANTGKDGYLFVPSGSGALVYPKTISSSGLSYSQEMYGDDPDRREKRSSRDTRGGSVAGIRRESGKPGYVRDYRKRRRYSVYRGESRRVLAPVLNGLCVLSRERLCQSANKAVYQ